MRHWKSDDGPGPELLAAYVDGELDGDTRRQVAAWLATRPDLAAELAEHGRLTELYRATAPVEPAAWDGVKAKIEAQLQVPDRRRRAAVVGVLTTAACLLLAVQSWLGGRPRPPAPVPTEEPLVLASPAEIEIISIAAADVGALVVGEPPLREPLVLAAADDMTLASVEPPDDGMVPYVPEKTP